MTDMDFMKKVEQIARARRIKQVDLARAAGCSESQISKLMAGEKELTNVHHAYGLARFLQVPLEYLLDDDIKEVPLHGDDAEVVLRYWIKKRGIHWVISRVALEDEPREQKPDAVGLPHEVASGRSGDAASSPQKGEAPRREKRS